MEKTKKQSKASPMRLLVGACSLVLMISGAHAALAQQGASNHSVANQPAITATGATPYPRPSSTAVQEEQRATPGKAGGEGIKIHGHWVMDLKNADGKVVDHRDFENSLITTYTGSGAGQATNSGSAMVAAVLSGNMTPADLGIGFVQAASALSGDPSTWCSPQGAGTPSGIACYGLLTANSLFNYPAQAESNSNSKGYVYRSVGLNISSSFVPTPSIVLSGNFTVPAGLTVISAVQTLWGGCVPANSSYYIFSGNSTLQGTTTSGNSTIGGNTCNNFDSFGPTQTNPNGPIYGALTSTTVPPLPMSVTPGQILSISVTITFS